MVDTIRASPGYTVYTLRINKKGSKPLNNNDLEPLSIISLLIYNKLTLADMLDEQLKFPVLNRPEGLLLPDELFFDSTYHLTRKGARKRTEILVESLREYSR